MLKRAFLLCLFCFAPGLALGEEYAFPLHAEDLKAGERFSTFSHQPGIQGRGRDIHVRRFDGNGNWSALVDGAPSNPDLRKNEHSLAYGRPFYAIADGEVIGCWRNAPENPRPGEAHPMRDQNGKSFIIGGGNHLWVRQDDGIIVLYAHAIPETIPAAICPNGRALTASPAGGGGHPDVDPQAFVPAGISPAVATGTVVAGETVRRPRVRKGQQLGLIGNSGSAGGPHLHDHGEQVIGPNQTRAADLVFERGLFKFLEQGSTDLDGWRSFSGKTLPEGTILVWPARQLGNEYTRHGLPLDTYSRLAQHLANSGFMPVVLDCYGVGGKTFVNMTWRPKDADFRAFVDLTRAQYQARFDSAVAAGLKPVFVDSCSDSGGQRYSAIFKKEPGGFFAQHGLSQQQHQALFEAKTQQGFVPVSIAVVEKNGDRDYTVLYHKENIGRFRLRSRLQRTGNVDQYQKAFEKAIQDGLHPVYLNAYMFGGRQHFVALFAERPAGTPFARHNQTKGQFQTAFAEATGNGFLTQSLTAFDGAKSKHVFAGVWLR
jgi:hypothetical protein